MDILETLDEPVANLSRIGVGSMLMRGYVDFFVVNRSTVMLTDEDVLGGVNETTSEVTRLSGLEGRICLTLTSSVCRDEVFESRESFLKI